MYEPQTANFLFQMLKKTYTGEAFIDQLRTYRIKREETSWKEYYS